MIEVILREHVDNLGRRGEIVKVADGYARNYLLPRKLALPATTGNKKHVERERKIMEPGAVAVPPRFAATHRIARSDPSAPCFPSDARYTIPSPPRAIPSPCGSLS